MQVRMNDNAANCGQPYRLCVAPMMAWTDRHCRFLHRLVAPSARLYTEMVTTDALLHGNTARALRFSAEERPLALQVGGNDPTALARAARLAADAGFDEVNLNVGCPSTRVQKGDIGACLMRKPQRVADGVAAMLDAVSLPVTVKCRIGLDDTAVARARVSGGRDYGFLRDFVGKVAATGVQVFIVHARKAVLSGLTPAQNRSLPPLRPELVSRLKRDFPHLTVVMNGGILSAEEAHCYLVWADGVMIGRGAYHNPLMLSRLNGELFGEPPKTAGLAFAAYLRYIDVELRRGTRLHDMTRHLMTLFNGVPGARRYRRFLSDHDRRPGAGVETLRAAAALVNSDACSALTDKV